jgi:hypothetical protein
MAKRKTKKRSNGLAGYRRFINSKPGVKAAKKRISKLEMDLKRAKRKKEIAVNKAKKVFAKKRK